MPPKKATKKGKAAAAPKPAPKAAAAKATTSKKRKKNSGSSSESDSAAKKLFVQMGGVDDDDDDITGAAKKLGGLGGVDLYHGKKGVIEETIAMVEKAQKDGEFASADWDKVLANTTNTNQAMELELAQAKDNRIKLNTKLEELASIPSIPEIAFPSPVYQQLRKEYEQERNKIQKYLPTAVPLPPQQPLPQSNITSSNAMIEFQQKKIEELEAKLAAVQKERLEIPLMKKKLQEIAVTGRMAPGDKEEYSEMAFAELRADEVMDLVQDDMDEAWKEAEEVLSGLSVHSPYHWNKVAKKQKEIMGSSRHEMMKGL